MYKCCWNCGNGSTAIFNTKRETEEFACTKRFCLAPRPVSQYPINPFQKRTCKQFVEPYRNIAEYRHFIDRTEAMMLMDMSKDEQLNYWRSNRN